MNEARKQQSKRVRQEATELAFNRNDVEHLANGDEQRYAQANYAMCFTKGLEHNDKTGLINDPRSFEAFRHAIDHGFIDPFTDEVPVAKEKERAWEAPTAGVVFDLEGPDPQAVTMAPAPALGSKELAYEMAEVYELATLRDVPFAAFEDSPATGAFGSDTASQDEAQKSVRKSSDRLNEIAKQDEQTDWRPRKFAPGGAINAQTAFRGSSVGVETGPYLSQFLLIGNPQPPLGGSAKGVEEGIISYGAQSINQRVPVAFRKRDYLRTKGEWLKVQNGANTLDTSAIYENEAARFITTPRDLATYVHFDALYQAYLNACIIMLGMGTPFDPAFAALSGVQSLPGGKRREAGGFALYGGPHILTLVTEVATRALKAVRYQKFNNHIRLRPEALAGRIALRSEIGKAFPFLGTELQALFAEIEASVKAAAAIPQSDGTSTVEGFLPMAFQEGSPMHPAYGAGHATVAGACVTILKAFFDTSATLVHCTAEPGKECHSPTGQITFKATNEPAPSGKGNKKAAETCAGIAFVPNSDGSKLVATNPTTPLTVEGELNKLAANISIGRNMGGVHYYSDYYDSLRMGEEIAIGILEEQALCYPTDRFVLSLPTFDGNVVRIGRR